VFCNTIGTFIKRRLIIFSGCTIVPYENNEIRFGNLVRGFLALRGIDSKLVSEAWIRNHYRWIVWKLAAFEKSYPHLFAKRYTRTSNMTFYEMDLVIDCQINFDCRYLTIDNVLHQLKYRYDREIDRCERSALKRILECDDTPSRPIILCVASIKSVKKNSSEKGNTRSTFVIMYFVKISGTLCFKRVRIGIDGWLV
jgi:breast cancer 2 susceptibility protein